MTNSGESICRRRWWELGPVDQHRRQIDVWILKQVRKEKLSLTAAARHTGVTVESVVENTCAFHKVGQRWAPDVHDTISVERRIYSHGEEMSIVTNDSDERDNISQYFDAVYKLWYDGETEPLESLKGLTVRDEDGIIHELDCDVDSVLEILSRYEEAEFAGPSSI